MAERRDLSQSVRRPPSFPDRRQFRLYGRNRRDVGAEPCRSGASFACAARRMGPRVGERAALPGRIRAGRNDMGRRPSSESRVDIDGGRGAPHPVGRAFEAERQGVADCRHCPMSESVVAGADRPCAARFAGSTPAAGYGTHGFALRRGNEARKKLLFYRSRGMNVTPYRKTINFICFSKNMVIFAYDRAAQQT